MKAHLRAGLERLPVGRQQVALAAYHARRHAARVDNPEVRKGRKLLTLLRTAPPDVLYLGDSLVSFISPQDQDVRNLAQLVVDGIGPAGQVHTLHGGSYHPALHDAYVRLIEGTAARPVVVVPLCVRVRTLPWIEHPVFGHRRATDYLAGVDPAGPARQIRAGFPRPTPSEFERFYRLPHHTWAGELTVGDYIRELKANPTGDDRVPMLYAYHHGGAVQTGAAMDDVTRLGRRLRDLGVPTVVYQTPVPVQHGSHIWGEGFRDLAAANFTALDAAFRAGYGEDAEILQTGLIVPTEEFIDPKDASEHVNEKGRARLAEIITTAVHERLRDNRARTAS